MQAVLKAHDGREMPTGLFEGFKQHFGLATLEDLIEVIYQRGWGVKERDQGVASLLVDYLKQITREKYSGIG